MKKILAVILFTIAVGLSSWAQSNKLEVVCYVYDRQAHYADMQKILPDSLINIFVKVEKKWRLGNLKIVNMLTLNGWVLSNYAFVDTREVYVLKHEIILNDEAYKIVLKNLELFQKPQQ